MLAKIDRFAAITIPRKVIESKKVRDTKNHEKTIFVVKNVTYFYQCTILKINKKHTIRKIYDRISKRIFKNIY